MEIEIQDRKVGIKPTAFTMQSDQWLWDDRLTDGEKIKLMKLYWRYDFFRSKAKKKALSTNTIKVPATNYLYMTQDGYADLLKVPRNKVSALFKKLEECNYLVRVKSGTQKVVNGVLENVPRDYVVILNQAHEDYHKDLTDVWKALSQRLSSMEEGKKVENVTYKQMVKSYNKLFAGKKRYEAVMVDRVQAEIEEVNFGILSESTVECIPDMELPPLSVYDDMTCNAEEELPVSTCHEDFLKYSGWDGEGLPF